MDPEVEDVVREAVGQQWLMPAPCGVPLSVSCYLSISMIPGFEPCSDGPEDTRIADPVRQHPRRIAAPQRHGPMRAKNARDVVERDPGALTSWPDM
jgi:hypothetical protein